MAALAEQFYYTGGAPMPKTKKSRESPIQATPSVEHEGTRSTNPTGSKGSAQRSVSNPFSNQNKYILNENGQFERVIRKRKRKSGDQLKTLMREFEKNPNWSKETLLEISKKSGLSEAQVYKWGWDQKRKKFGPEVANLMEEGLYQFPNTPQFRNSENKEGVVTAYNTEMPNNGYQS